jgi:hypothetical protein
MKLLAVGRTALAFGFCFSASITHREDGDPVIISW